MKGILFSTPMVQAILEGRKTVTRRKIDRDITNFCDVDTDGTLLDYQNCDGDFINPVDLCRYKVGDILYVREKFNDEETDSVLYAADKEFTDFGMKEVDGYMFVESEVRWKPSIHMPKSAARIFLKVTDVRVEKLQDITETQVRKEGFRDYLAADDTFYPSGYYFRQTWDGTIKKQYIDKYSWDANPWVWVIEFQRVEV